MNVSFQRIEATPDLVAESPVWDVTTQRFFWIDVLAGRVRCLEPRSGELRQWDTPGLVHGTVASPGYIGSIGLDTDTTLLVALKDGLYSLDLATGNVAPRVLIPDCDPDTRLNDGKMDRQGRFVCGQATTNGTANSSLFRFNTTGEVEVISTGYYVSNGTCFSPDGRFLYYTDSFSRKILRFAYDPEGNTIGEPKVFFDTRSEDTICDGATVDSEGNLWCAMTKTGEAMKIGPDARVLDRIALPVEFPSCTGFGGDDMATLFVTTILDSKTGRTVSARPDECGVYAIRGHGSRGIPEARFGQANTA